MVKQLEGGEGGTMLRQPEVEPGPCTLVCAQQYEEGCDLWVLHRDRLEEREDVFAIGCDFSIAL